ncbi:hypothetical protein CNO14_04310 (plasmid) [Borrelia miyamotoi]|uniref:Lipoprotein n=1 Tax=Borrelia miyamotoi TaxID=47466 RepID=A0AAP8YWK6_9SPIR|nr:hypothetical protein [Borrelia miyamotoi]ATQ15230.1 hypothetical protein CNO14_04310 [Borrelia miyamotoi]ATQ16458.1 hypothetical protein CNO13_04555 [Borrelia miyamotoi]ATQ17559.1 hypothetical protein CNO12_04315 [Borrelia miyamotoi]ATQ18803.1 hypothetical protein CNO11_04305 [Borrelia miyamotoi]ATQ20053.1 hypothetical protein CNO10_04315 [Borrelia miyamotoi]
MNKKLKMLIYYMLCILGLMSCKNPGLTRRSPDIDRSIKVVMEGGEFKGLQALTKQVEPSSGVGVVADVKKTKEVTIVVDKDKAGTVSGHKTSGKVVAIDKQAVVDLEKKKLEEYYDKFSNNVARYKSEFLSNNSQIASSGISLLEHFKKVASIFAGLEQQLNIYIALGYDVEAIKKLGVILKKLDLGYPASLNYGDTKIANNLLNLLEQVGLYTKKIMNTHLSSVNLSRIKVAKTLDDIIAIDSLLESFIQERERAVKTIKDQITLLAEKEKKEDLMEELVKVINSGDDHNRTIKSASYSIVGFSDQIGNLISKLL